MESQLAPVFNLVQQMVIPPMSITSKKRAREASTHPTKRINCDNEYNPHVFNNERQMSNYHDVITGHELQQLLVEYRTLIQIV